MSGCNHDLAERETDAADGACSICLGASLAALKEERDRLREALEAATRSLDSVRRMALEADDEYKWAGVAGYATSRRIVAQDALDRFATPTPKEDASDE